MKVICLGPGCGLKFETTRATAKYHSDTCRQRARRHPDQVGKGGKARAPRRRDRLQRATRRELELLGKLDSTAGIVALELAEAIDAGAESAAALASLATAYDRAMTRATEDGPEQDPVKARAAEVEGRRLRVAGGGRAG